MRSSYVGLLSGLAFSIILVYLLIVVNFQSWLDPFIMISALPAALAGIAWFLFITHTTLSVPALMGAIMCMGVATANSILVVSFATEKMMEGSDSVGAALEAGFTRFRPVLMTALAMIIGMVPMALGLGDGGEQNAPLGRAVIGGLIFATVSTLFFVPAFFSVLHGSRRHPASEERGLSMPSELAMLPQTEDRAPTRGSARASKNAGRRKPTRKTWLVLTIALAVVAAVLLMGNLVTR
jgi:multidrug efflux pump subunit AcrB